MKMSSTKVIPYLIVMVPFLMVLIASFSITSFYLDKVTNYFEKAKENSINEYINLQKARSELKINQLTLLFEYTNNKVEPAIKKELKEKVDLAYKIANGINKKYPNKQRQNIAKERVKEVISEFVYNNEYETIFLTDYNANSVLKGSHLDNEAIAQYRDYDHRSIVYEEIQKVRKNGEGFISSRRLNGDREIIFVRNLGIYKWYVGSSMLIKDKQFKLKSKLLKMIQSMPVDKSEFIGVYKSGKKLYMSNDFQISINDLNKVGQWHKNQIKNHYFFSKYYEKFDWTVIYGFDTTVMSEKAQIKYENLEKILDRELDFVIKASVFISILVLLLSLILSLKINKIFKTYQKEVEDGAAALKELNNSLSLRVDAEVRSHLEKDKMLTQSSKMAEMGDMLSMIAHQWRQPLNQMSYILMNIESAYEYEELTQEYLERKIKEANELLEFMSVTIDDFKNYFSPDKSKEEVDIEEVIEMAMSLIHKILEKDNIQLTYTLKSNKKVLLYRNEFIQVILNLVKNSKDVFNEFNVENPKILISTYETDSTIVVKVADNAGGIDENIIDKIYDAYFTTKDKHNGTGLGLYMSKMIIEGHLGGKLSVENVENGACFSIEIPLSCSVCSV